MLRRTGADGSTLSSMGQLALVVALAMLTLMGTTHAQCASHSECGDGEYCDELGSCYPCTTCVVYHDSITGQCPLCEGDGAVGVTCSSHDECFSGRQYCDQGGGCFACQGCLILDDAINGDCPPWCSVDSPTSTTAPQVILASTNGPAYSTSNGSDSHSTEIAVGVVGCLLVILAVGGAVWYLRRTKRKEEKSFVEMTSALAAQEQARGSLIALTMRRQQNRHSQASLSPPQQDVVVDERGEYIDVAGLHKQHRERSPQPMDQQLYDDEFLELARDIGLASDV